MARNTNKMNNWKAYSILTSVASFYWTENAVSAWMPAKSRKSGRSMWHSSRASTRRWSRPTSCSTGQWTSNALTEHFKTNIENPFHHHPLRKKTILEEVLLPALLPSWWLWHDCVAASESFLLYPKRNLNKIWSSFNFEWNRNNWNRDTIGMLCEYYRSWMS